MFSPLPAELPDHSVRSYRAQIVAESWLSLAVGVLGLADAVLRKTLHATDGQVTLFATALQVPNLFAGVWGAWMEGREKRGLFVVAGLSRFLLLVTLALWSQPYWFVAMFLLATLMEPVFTTAVTALYQSNYPASFRATILGRVGAIGRVTFVVGALGAGVLLDRAEEHGAWILAGGGLVALVGTALYARIPFRNPAPAAPEPVNRRSRYDRWIGDQLRILREHPAFDRYERNYFLYGLAFMMLLPVTVFLLVDAFGMSYREISLIKLVVLQLGFMISAPRWGRTMDRRGPYGTAARAFLLLAIFPALLSLSLLLHRVELVWLAYFVFGVCMAGVHVTWSLSSVHFARGRDSSPFMGIHILAVGVRGLVGPSLGLLIYHAAGFHGALAVAGALFLTAGTLMRFSPDRRAEERAGREAREAYASGQRPAPDAQANTAQRPR